MYVEGNPFDNCYPLNGTQANYKNLWKWRDDLLLTIIENGGLSRQQNVAPGYCGSVSNDIAHIKSAALLQGTHLSLVRENTCYTAE